MKTPNIPIALATAFLTALLSPVGHAAAKVKAARSETDAEFKIGFIPPPAINDAATTATFTLVDGQRSRNGAEISALHDGRIPGGQDEPKRNFFFQGGTHGGRIQVDLGKTIRIKAVNSYSWHPKERAPQAYKLWAATGEEKNFMPSPGRDTDPRANGWKPIAKVDTRRKGRGGQHAVSITDSRGSSIGNYRYLLFDIDSADPDNTQSNTFFSEIDVIDADGPAPKGVPGKIVKTYKTSDSKYTFTIDTTIAPDLTKWVDRELIPVVRNWYPKMVVLLQSDGFKAPTSVHMTFRDDMGGVPAWAAGSRLSLSIPFFRGQLEREAKGCVIHELVHVIQNYGIARKYTPNPAPTPGWVSEGIPDYVRWFLFEPESKGALITKRNFANANYDGSYRISANFINWVVETHDKNFLQKLNAAAREGRYSDEVWKKATGKSAAELGADWKAANAQSLGLTDISSTH